MRFAATLPCALLALAALPAFAETKSFNIRDFSKLNVETAFEVEFTQGPNWSVTVDSEYGDLDKVVVEKRGDTLFVHRPSGSFQEHRVHDVVRITAPNLSMLDISTAVKFHAERLDAPKLEINARTAAQIEIGNLHTDSLTLRGDTAASLELSGSCGTLSANLSSASNLKAADLHCQKADVRADSASSARVYASAGAIANASSVSSIHVLGRPASFEQTKDTMSSVSRSD